MKEPQENDQLRKQIEGINYDKALRKGQFIVICFIAVLVITVFAFWNLKIDAKSFSDIWQTTNPVLLSVALLLISMSLPFVALRWRALYPKQIKEKANPFFLTGVLSAAFVLNVALPGPVGEFLCAGMVKQRYKMPFTTGLATLIVSRVIGLGSAAAIAGIMFFLFPFSIQSEWKSALWVVTIILGLGGVGLYSMVIWPHLFQQLLQFFAKRLPSYKLITKLFAVANEVLLALSDTANRGKKAYIESIFWANCGHLMVGSGIYVAALAIDLQQVDWSAITFTYALSIAASVVMFMLPGSALAWDVLFATTLKETANIALNEAITITLVIRFQQLLVAMIGVAMILLFVRGSIQLKSSAENQLPK